MKNKRINKWIVAIIIIILFQLTTFLIKRLADPVIVQGNSMEPTYHQGDILFTGNVTNQELHRGDVVIVRWPDTDYYVIKRIVGIPGDTLVIIDGRLYVNDVAQSQTGIKERGCLEEKITLDDEYFVMGDNYNHSTDSRHNGPAKLNYIDKIVK